MIIAKPGTIWKPAAPSNFESGRQAIVSRITFHHIVGDAQAALNRFQDTNDEVSSTYVIGSDGTIYQCVADNDTSYADGNYDSNSRTISIEHAGGLPEVPYTDAMYTASIQLVAWLIQTYHISDFKRHRDVIDKARYPGGTACPGNLDVERIVNGAQTLLKGEDMPNEGDAINFIRADRGDASYQPTTNEKTAAMKVSFKDWAYRLSSTNEGDAVNFLNAQKLPVTKDTKAFMQAQPMKHWTYDFVNRMDKSFVPINEQLFKKS